MRTDKSHINEKLKTSFVNSGRAAGAGVLYDRYDEESGYSPQPKYTGSVRLLSDYLSPQEKEALHGEVKIIKRGKENGR